MATGIGGAAVAGPDDPGHKPQNFWQLSSIHILN